MRCCNITIAYAERAWALKHPITCQPCSNASQKAGPSWVCLCRLRLQCSTSVRATACAVPQWVLGSISCDARCIFFYVLSGLSPEGFWSPGATAVQASGPRAVAGWGDVGSCPNWISLTQSQCVMHCWLLRWHILCWLLIWRERDVCTSMQWPTT